MKKYIKAIALVLSVILLMQTTPVGLFQAADKIPAGQFTAQKSAAEGVLITGPEGESFLTAEQAAAAGTSEATKKVSATREPSPITGEVVELRSENTKYFRHRDGTYIAAMYAEPVHYKDATGKYKDIDNSLQLNSKKLSVTKKATYTPAASGLDIRIPQDFANGQQLTIGKEGYTVGMGVKAQSGGTVDLSTVKAAVKNGLGDDAKDDSDTIKDNKIEADNAKKMELKKQTSSVTYKDIFPDADLEYVVTSGRIKESIFIKEAQKEYVYQFNLTLNGLITVPQEDGSIFLLKDAKDKEPLFVLEAPYMYDAAGEESTALKMILSEDGALTLTADETWINDESREFPVVIDPTFEILASGFQDAYISTAAKNTNYNSGSENYIGKGLLGSRRTYLRVNLPTLPDYSVVTNASLTVRQTNSDYDPAGASLSLFGFYCPLQASWSASSVTWNNQPLSGNLNGPHKDGTKKIDYAEISNNNISYTFNLTKEVKNWYEDIYNNNGLMFATSNESTSGQIRIGSVRNGTSSNKPAMTIDYNTCNGLEDYWAYETTDMGRSGTVNVNDYNGNMTYTYSDLAMTGNRLPINISHVYNSNSNVYSTYYSGMNLGAKFHLNLQELLIKIGEYDSLYTGDEHYRYKFYDSDGTLHYFKKNMVTNVTSHEYNTNLVVTTDENGGNPKITDEKGNKKFYNNAGQLFKLEDNNGNTQTFTFSGNRITKVTDGSDIPGTTENEARFATLNYNAYNQLINITDPAGRVTSFAYSGTGSTATLSSITYLTYPDSKTTTFQYVYLNSSLISRITAYDNSYTRVSYISTAGCGYRVRYVYQHDKAGAEADFLKFQYTKTDDSGQATGNTLVTNKIEKTKTYLFDQFGRANSITNQDGQSQYAVYNSNTDTVVNSNKFNKIVDNSELQTIANNLVKNHGFEQTAYWSALQTTQDGSYGYNTTENSGGNRSMKMELTSNSGVFEVDQDFTAAAGQNYTVSVDIKIPHDLTLTGNNGVKFGFVYCVNGVWQTDGSEWIASTTGNEFLDPELDRGWQRFTHTMTLPSGTLSNCHVFIELARAKGSAYFDNIQVEKSGGARYYNLVENSDFSNAPGATSYPTGTVPYGWTMSGTQSGDGVQVGADGRNYVLMTGSPKAGKMVSQTVPVNADVGDVLVIGGKAAAYAVMGGIFSIIAKIYSTATATTPDGTIKIDFDLSISMTHQTTASYFTLATPCHHVVYSFVYYDQVDGVSFDDAFIYVGNYGEHYEYDKDGQIDKVVNDDNEKSTDYTYVNNDLTAVDQTISGKKSNVASLDYEDHNVSTITNNSGTVIDLEYGNGNGQVTSQTITEGAPGNAPLKNTESMTYIQGGNYLKTFTDTNGGVTTYTYDNNDQALIGLVMKVVDPKGNETNYTYDPNTDELLSTTGYANPSTPSVTSFISQDYLPKTVTRNSTTYSYDYDNQNRVTAAKVGSQALVTNTYDSRQRLSEQSYANQAVYTPVYDSRDRLAGDKWNNVQTATYFYNENDRLSQFVDNTTGTTYKYDYAFYGLVNNIYGSNGSKTAYDYNAAGQISHLMFSKNNDTIYKARYQTNEKGNMEDVVLTTLGNGTLLHYNYDGFSRLTGNSCGPLITERTYLEGASYAPNLKYTTNLVETYTNKIDAAVMQQYEYVYDDNSNITGITETEANETTTYTYDGLNRLIGEVNPNNTYVYNYDVGGNLTTVTNNGLPVHEYTYGNSNWKDQLTSIDTNGITYDANGNPLTYDGYTFTWQRGRQLTAFTGNGQNISYTYDAQGRRIQQTVNGTTLTYTYSGDLLMRQSDGTNTLDFQYDANVIAAGFNYGTPYFYMRNLQGDVIAITDADGTLVAEYTYDAWGNVTAFSGAMASINPIRYRGYYQDPVTGWYFLQSRYYNPDWRRFLNADALFVAGDAISGSNMYAYCNGNPVMYQDPSGMGAFGDFVGNAIRVRSKVTSWLLLPVTYLVVAPASNVLLYATRNIVGEDPVEKVAPYLKSGAENILPEVPPIMKPGPSTIPTGLRHFMPINMAFGAPWAGYFLGFESSKYGKGFIKHKNYTTVEGKEMWQSQVGYDELYDFFFSLGGPIERIRYKFSEGIGSNTKYYAIWLWKGDYWNLGAGAEIGIYYTDNEDNAINNFYIIDKSLTLHVHMLIKYRTFFGQIPMTLNDFHQTNWWVCSFTPSIQFPNVDWIDVDLDVRFTGNNYYKLMRPFYTQWNIHKAEEDWEKVSMLPYAYKIKPPGHTTHQQCNNRPEFCGCTCPTNDSRCVNSCSYYTTRCDSSCIHSGESDDGFQFKITY